MHRELMGVDLESTSEVVGKQRTQLHVFKGYA